jgi:predicted N-formylglutamate amidohydrolase
MGAGHILITCEHASATLPPGAELGVATAALESHIGWDPGAGEIAIEVAQALGCEHIAGMYTRLWVDLNRPAESRMVVPDVSFGTAIERNARLTEEERAARVADYHAPHWRKVIAAVESHVSRYGGALHVAIHSFDPLLEPDKRQFDVGVLFDPSRAAEAAIAESLRQDLLAVGYDACANAPYLGIDEGMTTSLRERFAAAMYVGIEIEVSQSLATVRPQAEKLSQILAVAIRRCAQAWPR